MSILNGNLAYIDINILINPEERETLSLASTLFYFVSKIAICIYLFYKVVNNQTPSPLQGVSLLRENI